MRIRNLIHLVAAGLFALELAFPILSAAEEDIKSLVPHTLLKEYEKLDDQDKKEIVKLYDNSHPSELNFVGRDNGLNQAYNKPFLQCIDKQNDFVRKLTITHLMGTLTFSLIPQLIKYTALDTLDISGNRISDNMIIKNIECFKTLTNLFSLSLESNNILINGFKKIFDTFNSAEMKLSHLSLSKNKGINVKSAVDFIQNKVQKKEIIKIRELRLCRCIVPQEIEEENYQKIVYNLQQEYQVVCIFRELDTHLLTGTRLPIEKLIVASLKDNPIASEAEEKALPTVIKSPTKKTVSKKKWDTKQIIMTIDPSGSGSDATGYAVIKVNQDKANREYLIIEAGGIDGNGLRDDVFEELFNIADKLSVQYVAIESNYHQGAYLTAFNYYCQIRNIFKLDNEGKKIKDYPEQIGARFTLVNYETTEKVKGERIINTLKPLLEESKLFIEEGFFYRDYKKEKSSLFKEMTWIREDFKSNSLKVARHDDVVDALEMAISFAKTLKLEPPSFTFDIAAPKPVKLEKREKEKAEEKQEETTSKKESSSTTSKKKVVIVRKKITQKATPESKVQQ